MSGFPPANSPNPYDAPAPYGMPTNRLSSMQKRQPTFCKVMFITDLVFCILRVPIFLLGMVGLAALNSGRIPASFPVEIVWLEVISGLGIAVAGVTADILLLRSVRGGVILGWVAIAFTAVSVVVGITEGIMMPGKAEGPEAIGRVIGLVFSIAVRVTLLGLYGAALVQFRAWSEPALSAERFGP